MPVPDTTTFTLQDVVDEVNPTPDDLNACFTAALDRKFDLNYKTSPLANSLLSFRNYGNFRTIQLSIGANDVETACGLTAIDNDYYTDLAVLPTVGVTIYSNYLTDTVFNGLDKYYKFSPSTSYKIGTDGVIDSIHVCYQVVSISVFGSTTSSGGCGITALGDRYISINDVIEVGTTVYANQDLTSVLGGGDNWYKYGNSAIQIGNDGVIDTVVDCYVAIERSNTSYGSAALACADAMTSTTTVYYTQGDSLVDGTVIYSDIGLTTPFNGGGNAWKLGATFSCEISSSGVISRQNICF